MHDGLEVLSARQRPGQGQVVDAVGNLADGHVIAQVLRTVDDLLHVEDHVGALGLLQTRLRAAALEVDPSRIRMYRELDPTAARQAGAVVAGRASRSALNVPDPWYGTMADFVDTLEVVERVSDELVDELAALLG